MDPTNAYETERERELALAVEHMEFALEATDSTTWVWDVDDDVLTYYPSARTIYDQPNENRDDFLSIVHPADRDEVAAAIETALTETGTYAAEFRLAADEDRWIADEGTVEYDSDGRPDRMIGVAWDVSERKRRERQVAAQADRLEEFASIVSHDLRNPLSIIGGSLDLAAETGDPVHIDRCERAVTRMEDLIDDLLTVAREGRSAVDVQSVSLAEAAVNSWGMIETGDAELRVETARRIRADPVKLRQLLENLFANAVEHGSTNPPSHAREDVAEHGSTNPRSHAREDAVEHGSTSSHPQAHRGPIEHQDDGVTVTVGDLSDNEGFFVADDGPGIPASERDVVTEWAYTTDDDGIGFGLAIVSEIVDAHGWALGITDGADGGARFEIGDVTIES
ncbi:His Kinase A (phospho-acceptor) domain-containing protein [Halopenitus malekzadehii]|uniref:histidine kinase n=1 Tax=Halopenitus malekzadehii TaxID=1267564 RepID=A0A1H6IHW7_9EURY|nr:PAS domain-containing sensor histidine kinase [Halopenitus malekzadehii]SEH45965.1 His Kinase A (phospho-acceptor) domain-containing protein [Halopenitus malekzadehii]